MNVALTSYLLTLAMFIPASGRLADRFGSRTVFRGGDRAVHPGLDRLRAGAEPGLPGGRAHAARRRRRDDVAGRAAGAAARGVEGRAGQAMAWLMIPATIGPIVGPPVGGFIVTYLSWHWIFYINVPIGLRRHRAGHALHRGNARADPHAVRPARADPVRHRAGVAAVRHRDGEPRRRVWRDHLRPGGRRGCRGRGCMCCTPATTRSRCWIFA